MTPNLNDQEVAFIRWYVSVFGDHFRLIENVLNYHPLTRGYMRKKKFIGTSFIEYINSSTRNPVLNHDTVLRPWRTTG